MFPGSCLTWRWWVPYVAALFWISRQRERSLPSTRCLLPCKADLSHSLQGRSIFPLWKQQAEKENPCHWIPPGAFYVPRQTLQPKIQKPIWAVFNKTTQVCYDASFIAFTQYLRPKILTN